MKLPSKYIALLVILSLTGIFAYQAYWLVNLYHTQRQEVEHNITEALRISDYNEMMLRLQRMQEDSVEHGSILVSAGLEDKQTYAQSRTITTIERGDSTTILYQHEKMEDSDSSTLTYQHIIMSLADSAAQPVNRKEASLQMNDVSFLLGRSNAMKELANNFQRGLHAGMDVMCDPDFPTYDRLLAEELYRTGINAPYRLESLHRSDTTLLKKQFVDTLAIGGTPGYIPSLKAIAYEYSYDLHNHWVYRLTMEPVGNLVLRQMAGILTTSAVILIVLGFSFWFLIRTILRQKTLEEMKSDFTNNITHELKTPIAVAYAANDALLNFDAAADQEKRNQYLGICREQLERLSRLVEQILSMSMERRKTFRLHPETLDVQEILASLIEQHRLKADKPVHISLTVDPQAQTVTADRTHFYNIVSNLLDNAVKYSSGEAEISIRAQRTDEAFTLSVTDRGIGIPADKQKHVFDKFYRVPTGNLHDVKGYGLGLFYVKTMVEKHGGTVAVQSTVGRGSEFTIRLPQ